MSENEVVTPKASGPKLEEGVNVVTKPSSTTGRYKGVGVHYDPKTGKSTLKTKGGRPRKHHRKQTRRKLRRTGHKRR